MKRIKALLSKVKFTLGYSPVVVKHKDWRNFIPDPYKAVISISADFELAWASRYTKSTKDPYKKAVNNAKRERENIPQTLELCEKFNIPITWATVGHLFLDRCKAKDAVPHPEISRLKYFENKCWKYAKGDWFDNDPCTTWEESPEWYAPDLIQEILNKKVKHEIGCHTFSHIDCSDKICSNEVFESEINACKQAAKKINIELKSFIHPGHTIGNLNNLAKQGFTSFRTNHRNVLGYPLRHDNGLWEFEQTAEFVYRKAWSIEYHIHRYKEIINRAIKSNTVCALWFHPSFDTVVVEKILPSVFAFIQDNRDQVWVTTHREYVDWLNKDR